jgi:transcriptional regulator with XRE-family HTH domain
MYILKVKHYRMLHHLTQKQLACMVGVTQSYIAKLENIDRTESPTLRTIEKLCDVFNITLTDLVNVSDLTGLSLSTISEVEKGISNPTLYTLTKIAKALHIPLREVLRGYSFK